MLQTLLNRFYTLQQRRVDVYNQLHEAFKKMIECKEQDAFFKLIPELTEVFNRISKEVIEVEVKLQDEGSIGKDCAVQIRSIQLGEKQKLTATCQLYSLRKCFEFEEFPWQVDSRDEIDVSANLTEESYRNGIKQATQSLENSVLQINEALDELRCLVEQ